MKNFVRDDGHEETIFKPQLTSLIDVMTILLVFLIKSFSVTGNLVTPSKDLVLPTSTSKKNAKSIPSIEVSKASVIVSGIDVITIDKITESDSMMIGELFTVLKDVKTIDPESKSIMIQCDKFVKFSVLKKIMYTSSRAGFADYSVLVIGE